MGAYIPPYPPPLLREGRVGGVYAAQPRWGFKSACVDVGGEHSVGSLRIGDVILAIDPGTNTGWALLRDGALVTCGLGDPRTSSAHVVRDITDVIIEHPVIYPGGRTKNPNDVLKVAVNAGEWAGTYRQRCLVHYVTPQTWKGNVPKKVHQGRVWSKLSSAERAEAAAVCKRMSPKWSPALIATAPDAALWRNVLDAVGLGLFHVGR